ncbi:hypothetical protein SARC_02531 [Sphaeroforma arctica JP610]|uniref:Uncharacterized protein n=1 Tax=Sphaeroforma arctica JP610 TaxID=667725 RepID=A0A0L0G8A7_9EUKA|nr:hypothetical protein SARC_02531 [Sphaeroforma arctica JP610]KNC85272.1 hypothetical protein SARC_02531 [Sphaeroforma arctica JP610]|eukprot:XP_014159174.1 hypothetical protein SARC_02531 [Sphaeroforma arctica JP610]
MRIQREKWTSVLSDVDPLLVELESERQKHRFLSSLEDIETHAKVMETAMTGGEMEKTLAPYNALFNLNKELATNTSYMRLQSHCQHKLESCYSKLIQRYSDDFRVALEQMHWPQTFSNKLGKPDTYNKGLIRFQLMFCLMLDLKSPYESGADDKEPDAPLPDSMSQPEQPPTRLSLLPLNLMLEPLEKRFRYHFSGRRETNRIDKPEWMYTFLINVLKSHFHLLTKVLQPLLDRRQIPVHTVTLFTQSLVKLVNKKLELDMDKFTASREILSHVIAETLAFERELKGTYFYPTDLPISVHVFTGDRDRFALWLKYETTYALERLDMMMDSPVGNTFKYQGVEGMKSLRPTEVSGDVLLLLQSITERYHGLSDVTLQYQFISHIQIRILAIFLNELETVTVKYQEDLHEAIDRQESFMMHINSVFYLYTIVADWSEQVFFMDIYERLRANADTYEAIKKDRRTLGAEHSTTSRTSVDSLARASTGGHAHRQARAQDTDGGDESHNGTESGTESEAEEHEPSEYIVDDVEGQESELSMGLWASSASAGSSDGGGVFKGILKKYRLALDELLGRLTKSAVDGILPLFKAYRRQRWTVATSTRAAAHSDVSLAVCEPFQVIKEFMDVAHSTLAEPLFNHIWPRIAKSVSQYILNEVICTNFFNEGGAKQLQIDSECLFRMFKLYTNQPENFFKQFKETVLLLNMDLEKIQETKAKLTAAEESDDLDETAEVLEHLASLNVYKLTADQALTVLGRFLFPTKS